MATRRQPASGRSAAGAERNRMDMAFCVNMWTDGCGQGNATRTDGAAAFTLCALKVALAEC